MSKSKLHTAEQYATDVLSGKILAPKTVQQACQRYFDDRKTGIDRGIYFNEKAAIKVIRFYEKILKHYKGDFAGKPFLLQPWQQFYIWNLFGFQYADGRRRFRYSYVSVPRKNGKSALLAGLGIYMLGFDGEQSAEVYSAATTRKQARLIFDAARSMVIKSPALRDYITAYQHNLHIESTFAKFEPLSKEAEHEEGSNPSCGLVDEYHLHPSEDSVFKMLKSGMGARHQPHIALITTAGFNIQSPCFKYEKVCRQILEGSIKQDDLFALIYTPDEDDDWESPVTWRKVNASWDHITTLPSFIEAEYRDAKNNSDKVTNFITKHCNKWTSAATTWILDRIYMASGTDFDPAMLEGMECTGGLDLASRQDITQLTLTFYKADEDKYYQLYFPFVPALTAKERVSKDNVNYDVWIRSGHIIETGGNTTDYRFIRRFISGYYVEDGEVKHDDTCLADKYNIRSIGFDKWNSTQLADDLRDDGVTMNEFRQGYASMSYPTKEFHKLILDKKLDHGNNPPMRWMIGNVTLAKDPAGNIKIDKSKSIEKVDGPVSAVMSLGEYLTPSEETDYSSAFEKISDVWKKQE